MDRPGGYTKQHLIDGVDRSHIAMSASQRDLLSYIAECDRAGVWINNGCRDMAEWLAGRLGVTNWVASRWVAASHAIGDLPLIAAALETGVLSLEKAVELTRFATPETERQLISWAKRVNPSSIRKRADRELTTEQEARAAQRERSLSWSLQEGGTRLSLYGFYPAAEGLELVAAIEAMAEQLPSDPPEDDDVIFNDCEQRYADALWALAIGGNGTASASKPTVVVHTTLSLLGLSHGGTQEGGVLHSTTCNRLACDGRLQFVVNGTDGNALGIGHESRNVPTWLEREVRFRDDHRCTFPGCNRKAFLQSHHIKHWPKGPTDLSNLTTVCHFHHRLVHERGWNVALVGSVTHWFKPNRQRYLPGPAPPRQLGFYPRRERREELELAAFP